MSAHTKHMFLCAALFGTAAYAVAQDTQPGGEYVIQGIFSPTIADVRKIDMRPQPIDTILPDRPVSYQLLTVKADIPSRVDSIEPARLTVLAPQPRLYKGYVKAGFGLYTTPLGEIYFDQTRSRKNTWGMHARHFSSNGGIDDVGPSEYSFNSVDGHYTHFLPDHEVGGRLIYDRRRVSYYGFTASDSLSALQNAITAPEDFTKQVYNDIGFAGRIRSLYKDSTRIAHEADVEVHAYSNLTGSSETNIRFGAALGKREGNEHFALGLIVDNNAYRGDLGGTLGEARISGTLLGLTPSVSTLGRKYTVRVGAGLYLDALGRTTFHFYPNAFASYSLFDDILIPYAGVEGAKERNSLRSLTRENPWLTGAPNLVNSSRQYDLYGGLRGSFSRHVGFDVRVSSTRIDDMPLFVNVPNEPFADRMAVVYDRVDILNISGELRYRLRESISFNGRMEVLTYQTNLQEEAWNLPPYRLALGGRYSMQEKLILKAEVLFLGSRPAFRQPVPPQPGELPNPSLTTELDGFMDLYLGIEYRYTKRLSVFLDMSNLSASKYERWYRHPVQRGLVMGGATYAF